MSNFYSGNNITIENLGNSKAKINKIGMSWQETRSGKNILPNLNTTRTINGVTFTHNEDGSVTINGTATANISYPINVDSTTNSRTVQLAADTDYILSGCSGGSSSTYLLQCWYAKDEGEKYVTNATLSQSFSTTEESMLGAYIRVYSGATVSNKKIYPMITLASEADQTYEQYGAMPSPEFRSEIQNVNGSANIIVTNENLLYDGFAEDFVERINDSDKANITIINGKKYLYFLSSVGYIAGQNFKEHKQYFIKGIFKEKTKYTFSAKIMLSAARKEVNIAMRYTDGSLGYIMLNENATANEEFDFSLTSDPNKTLYSITVTYQSGGTFIDLSTVTLKEGSSTDYIENKTQKFTFPLSEGQKLYKDSYLADDGLHHKRGQAVLNGSEKWQAYVDKNTASYYCYFVNTPNNCIVSENIKGLIMSNLLEESTWDNIYARRTDTQIIALRNNGRFYIRVPFSTVEDLKTFLATTNLIVEYELAEEVIEPYTAEQENVYMQLQNIELYQGINHIYFEEETKVEISVVVNKLIEDYDVYISSTGRLIIPALNINYLIDLNESDIPTMPEAVESSVRAAGRDGDIVLNTTYEPIPFNIVCYTEDNLTLFEKVEEEKKINKFLNSIKNKTIPFALEKADKFYNVKYNGALTTINYPAHLKFSIPLKSSESYGKDLIQKSIVGSSIGESETEKEVGALFVLRGPAINPIVSLNDYSMEYNMNILEGARVEIDSVRSTITNINSDGIRTNVMKYYNHQFPKIENGINELKVLSGFDSDLQVSVIWNDLKL